MVGEAVDARTERHTTLQRLPAIPIKSLARPRAAFVLPAVAAIIASAGCSTQISRRDEYYLIRGLTFQPTPGDGSTIVVGRDQDVLRAIAGAEAVPMRGVDLDR